MWDPSPEAIEGEKPNDQANIIPRYKISGLFYGAFKRLGIPENEMSPSHFYLQAGIDKFKVGTGPYPQPVTVWMNALNDVAG